MVRVIVDQDFVSTGWFSGTDRAVMAKSEHFATEYLLPHDELCTTATVFRLTRGNPGELKGGRDMIVPVLIENDSAESILVGGLVVAPSAIAHDAVSVGKDVTVEEHLE